MAQYTHLSTPDPEWAELSAQLPLAKPLISIQAYKEEAMKYRAILATQGDSDGAPKIPGDDLIRVLEKNLPVEGGEIRVRAYIPHAKEGETQSYPLLVWMYGGGWTLGIIENDEPFLKRLAADLRITCVCGDYRKTPEHPYPAAVNDSYAIFKWALNPASDLSIDTTKGVIVGGASAGANIAAVLAHKALKDPQYKGVITGQYLVVPAVISPYAYPDKFKSELLSVNEDADRYCLTKDQVLALAKAYHGEVNAANPEVSPALSESFEGLPPAYIQICGLDPLRDEGFLYERLLKEAKVPTKVDVYPGLPHGFPAFFPSLAASKKQNVDFIQGFLWLLQQIKH